MKLVGKMSTFGGPSDTGVGPDEGLALIGWSDLADWWFGRLFLQSSPPGTTGLARRLNPRALYIACRWDYNKFSKQVLRRSICRVSSNRGKVVFAQPCDWGPGDQTGRIADLSPGAAGALGLKTDDIVTVELITP